MAQDFTYIQPDPLNPGVSNSIWSEGHILKKKGSAGRRLMEKTYAGRRWLEKL